MYLFFKKFILISFHYKLSKSIMYILKRKSFYLKFNFCILNFSKFDTSFKLEICMLN